MPPPILSFRPDEDAEGHLRVDLQRLLEHKLAIQANSRGGKSWLLRTLLEGTHGLVQHLVIDPEGEYRTLREAFNDYVILARIGGDLDLTPASTARVVPALVTQGASIILDLDEWRASERDTVCAEAVHGLMDLPRTERRHLLVVVDEAQTLAPQDGSGAALSELTDLAMRGAKRGFGLVIATQRISLLNKNVLAMCSNRLIGLTTLGNDVKRAGEELGFSARERGELKRLAQGEFFAFGPAISQQVVRVRSGPVRTTHPRTGQIVPPTPPASEALARVIEGLRAQQEVEEAGAGNEQTRPVATGVSEAEVARRVREAVVRETAPLRARIEALENLLRRFTAEAHKVLGTPSSLTAVPEERDGQRKEENVAEPQVSAPGETQSLSAPQRRILQALAEMEALGLTSLDRRTTAVLSAQSPRSSAYGNHVAALRAGGFITYPEEGLLALTDAGREVAPKPTSPTSLGELHRRWLEYLSSYEGDLLRVLIDCHPAALSREELAARSGRSYASSAFGNAVASLKSLGLVNYPREGQVQATPLLFPEALLEKEEVGSR